MRLLPLVQSSSSSSLLQQRSQQHYNNSIVIISSSIVVTTITIWKLLQWRAHKRAKETVNRLLELMCDDGPLIAYDNRQVCDFIMDIAIRRAKKWISLGADNTTKPMIGQVGGGGVESSGLHAKKRPLLTLQPDYVLKPILSDHRGIREVAFYEAIRLSTKSPTCQVYTEFLKGGRCSHNNNQNSKKKNSSSKKKKKNSSNNSDNISHFIEYIDTLAVALAMYVHDPVVTRCENTMNDIWKAMKREVEALHNLAKFTAPYYGVIGRGGGGNGETDHHIASTTTIPYGIVANNSDDHNDDDDDDMMSRYLLLQDLTANFSKPNVMDIKIGTQTYEPDASPSKRIREYNKYPQQTQYGFRIIGMRIYDPKQQHPTANNNNNNNEYNGDGDGFRYFDKTYGRSLQTRDQILNAFRIFFGGSSSSSDDNDDNHNDGSSNTRGIQGSSSTNTTTTTTSSFNIRSRAVNNVIVQLRPIRRWFHENQSFKFYASSLLIVYEGDITTTTTTKEENNDHDHHHHSIVDIKMIDFGHVRRIRRQRSSGSSSTVAATRQQQQQLQQRDDGYRAGLSTLNNLLHELLEQQQNQNQQ